MIGKRLSHYTILSQLGIGGMGEVYRARDEMLDREVAIKLLPEDVRADREKLIRLIREAKAASALKHPNTASIFELGEAEGVHFIAMELVDGKTLQTLMSERNFTPVEVADLGIQIAAALEEAHANGIIHRDIKPSNIMLSSNGYIKVLDFGLAKVSQEASSSPLGESHHETLSGAILGTVHYISPEQVLGKDIDGRSDLFSLGAVLYQLACAVLPFRGDNVVQMIDSILHSEPVPPSMINRKIPANLERVILRLLEKDKNRRYSSADDVVKDLRAVKGTLETGSMSGQIVLTMATKRWLTAALVAIIAVVTIALWNIRSRPAQENDLIDSIAVLPFSNSSSDPDSEYLSDGITEGIINRLSELPGLKVMARGTVFTYKDKEVDPRKVGKELRVDALVTGDILQMKEKLVIRADLVRTSDGTQIWGQQYNWNAGDLPKVQSEIATEISGQLRSRLTGEER